MTTTQRDGLLTIDGGRLRFFPETYPVAHLRREGWRKESDGSWSAPLVADYARQLRALFPHTEYGEDFIHWIAGLVDGLRRDEPIGHIFTQRPPRWNDLYPYQQRAAEWLTERKSGLLCLSPGLGKSAVALTAARILQARQIVVVCPLTLLGVWERERRLWWPDAPIALLTYGMLARHGLPIARPDLLIFDESVLLKNRKAQRTKAAAVARKQAKVCWLLSGSPTTRFYDDLWAQLHVLEPKSYPSYWRFASSCTLSLDTIWGRQIVANAPGIEAQLKRDLAPILHTYNYADLAREDPSRAIPEWTFETRQVPLPAKWWRLYKQMQDKFVADLPDGERVLAPNTLVRLVRLLQFASHPALLMESLASTISPHDDLEGEGVDLASQDSSGYDWSTKGGKLSAIPDLLDELPGPVIVWTNFVATAKHLATTLHAPCLIGETPADERTRVVADFQAGKYPVVIAHPGVGRFGLTLTRARSAIYCERSYDGDAWTQSLYRLRRIGTVEPPQIVVLEATGPDGQATVDRVISLVLGFRLNQSIEITTATVKEALQ